MTYMFSSPRKLRYAHAIVLETFVGERPAGMTSSHLNGNRADNRVENLAWEAHADNMRRKVSHGTEPLGDERWSAKITKAQAIYAKTSNIPLKDAANMIGVSISQVSRIRLGQCWPHLSTASQTK
jgi:hypothetical protein